MMADPDTDIITETKKQMDIVPYTRRDRVVTVTILVVVIVNFLILLMTYLGFTWGSI